MRKILFVVFGCLILLSLVLLVVGLTGMVVSPWLSSEKAQLMGTIMLVLASLGEVGVRFFSWAAKKTDKTDPGVIQKYGLK
jgi:cation transporter-like permease